MGITLFVISGILLFVGLASALIADSAIERIFSAIYIVGALAIWGLAIITLYLVKISNRLRDRDDENRRGKG